MWASAAAYIDTHCCMITDCAAVQNSEGVVVMSWPVAEEYLSPLEVLSSESRAVYRSLLGSPPLSPDPCCTTVPSMSLCFRFIDAYVIRRACVYVYASNDAYNI